MAITIVGGPICEVCERPVATFNEDGTPKRCCGKGWIMVAPPRPKPVERRRTAALSSTLLGGIIAGQMSKTAMPPEPVLVAKIHRSGVVMGQGMVRGSWMVAGKVGPGPRYRSAS